MRWRFWNRKRRGQDLDDEIRAHLEIEERERREGGESEHAARAHASRDFGNVALVKETTRNSWGWTHVEQVLKDAAFGARALARNRTYTLMSILTIVLSVGGVSAVFALLDSVLFEPLPYPNSDRLVVFHESSPDCPNGCPTIPEAVYLRFQDEIEGIDAFATYHRGGVYTLDSDGEPYQVQLHGVSPELFPLLGFQPALGRLLTRNDDADGDRAVVISHEVWRDRFGMDPDVLGRALRLPNFRTEIPTLLTVVGVMPPEVELPPFMFNSVAPDVWSVPAFRNPPSPVYGQYVIGRLGPDSTFEALEQEVRTVYAPFAEGVQSGDERRVWVTPMLDTVVGEASGVLWIFFGAVSSVFLIGLANLASLQVARNAERRAEMRLRTALGASRARLVGQLATEAIVLGVAGGLASLPVASAAVKVLRGTMPESFPRLEEVGFDWSSLSVTFLISLLAGLIIGGIPGWRASARRGTDIAQSLRLRGIRTQHSKPQRVLIGFETASAMILLVTAGLLANSLWRLFTEDVGIREDNLYAVEIRLPLTYQEPSAIASFWRDLTDAVESLPGVASASFNINSGPPIKDGRDVGRGGILPEGSTLDRREDGFVFAHRLVSPGYFETHGIQLVDGRPIGETDGASNPPVAVLNEMAAQMLWPAERAVGKRMSMGAGEPLTVIGVIPNAKNQALDEGVFPQLYTSFFQFGGPGYGTLSVRYTPGRAASLDLVRNAITAIEPDVETREWSMAGLRWELVAEERFRTFTLLTFAGIALILAVVGIFGVIAYSVVQKQREIGIRIAVGATRRHVRSLILGQAIVPVLVGLGIGLVVSTGLSRVLERFLYEIRPNDPVTMATAVLAMLMSAFAAAWIPARRALKIEPMVVLRDE